MSSFLFKVLWLELNNLNNLQSKEDGCYNHTNNIAKYNLTLIIIPKVDDFAFHFVTISDVLVPQHLHEEWNDVTTVKQNESLKVSFCVSKQRVNDLL